MSYPTIQKNNKVEKLVYPAWLIYVGSLNDLSEIHGLLVFTTFSLITFEGLNRGIRVVEIRIWISKLNFKSWTGSMA